MDDVEHASFTVCILKFYWLQAVNIKAFLAYTTKKTAWTF
jgi:hypothetical protein